MLLLRSLKPIQRWRTFIAILLAVIVVNFASVPRANAFLNAVDEVIIENINVRLPSSAEWGEWGREFGKRFREELEKIDTKTMGQQLGEGLRGEFEKFINSLDLEGMGQQLGEGLRKEFEKAMDRLFDKKIKPLVADIDKFLKARLDQTDKMAKARIKQIDDLIQATFKRFQAAADKTIAKVKTNIIGYAFDRFNNASGKLIAKIKADIIDHAASTFKKVTDETVTKIKADLDDLRRNFRADVDHFFYRTEYLINTVDCKVAGTLEKIRNNFETIGKKLVKQLKEERQQFKDLSLEVNIKGTLMSGYSGDVSIKSDPRSPVKKPLSQCYQGLGLTKPPESWEYSSIYDLYKCDTLKTLSQQTPIRRILNVYLDLKAQAARMACVQRGAGHHATLHYTWDWLEFGYWYDFWYAYQ